ncbi:MAG: anaerobic ribonucleoside-triphosphate reductase activating protein [Methanothermobacter sp.]|jgi:pyruvate formate lyase activating enzyme|nr:anaerobic ribonucleoside-triphosphate reductase activating protein [Methanothermobacter thermautotrophicus]MCQ8904183.1 anaerobic ribonucleoside-triphosphate reductase activating protein [Methanothermobacter sp.]
MKIGSMAVSTLDYPGKTALVIFTAGCNFRCPYCHNPELIDGGYEADLETILDDVESYSEFVEALVVSGGEPLLQANELEAVLEHARSLGLSTKLDTNGSCPESLERLIPHLDYVAIDVKAPFQRYPELAGASAGGVMRSLEILRDSGVTVECRTTFVPGLMEDDDIELIAGTIECDVYVLQQFRNRTILDESLKDTEPPSPRRLREIAMKIRDRFSRIKIRTEEFGEEDIR